MQLLLTSLLLTIIPGVVFASLDDDLELKLEGDFYIDSPEFKLVNSSGVEQSAEVISIGKTPVNFSLEPISNTPMPKPVLTDPSETANSYFEILKEWVKKAIKIVQPAYELELKCFENGVANANSCSCTYTHDGEIKELELKSLEGFANYSTGFFEINRILVNTKEQGKVFDKTVNIADKLDISTLWFSLTKEKETDFCAGKKIIIKDGNYLYSYSFKEVVYKNPFKLPSMKDVKNINSSETSDTHLSSPSAKVNLDSNHIARTIVKGGVDAAGKYITNLGKYKLVEAPQPLDGEETDDTSTIADDIASLSGTATPSSSISVASSTYSQHNLSLMGETLFDASSPDKDDKEISSPLIYSDGDKMFLTKTYAKKVFPYKKVGANYQTDASNSYSLIYTVTNPFNMVRISTADIQLPTQKLPQGFYRLQKTSFTGGKWVSLSDYYKDQVTTYSTKAYSESDIQKNNDNNSRLLKQIEGPLALLKGFVAIDDTNFYGDDLEKAIQAKGFLEAINELLDAKPFLKHDVYEFMRGYFSTKGKSAEKNQQQYQLISQIIWDSIHSHAGIITFPDPYCVHHQAQAQYKKLLLMCAKPRTDLTQESVEIGLLKNEGLFLVKVLSGPFAKKLRIIFSSPNADYYFNLNSTGWQHLANILDNNILEELILESMFFEPKHSYVDPNPTVQPFVDALKRNTSLKKLTIIGHLPDNDLKEILLFGLPYSNNIAELILLKQYGHAALQYLGGMFKDNKGLKKVEVEVDGILSLRPIDDMAKGLLSHKDASGNKLLTHLDIYTNTPWHLFPNTKRSTQTRKWQGKPIKETIDDSYQPEPIDIYFKDHFARSRIDPYHTLNHLLQYLGIPGGIAFTLRVGCEPSNSSGSSNNKRALKDISNGKLLVDQFIRFEVYIKQTGILQANKNCGGDGWKDQPYGARRVTGSRWLYHT